MNARATTKGEQAISFVLDIDIDFVLDSRLRDRRRRPVRRSAG
jgi:hypothetical protein